MSWNYLPLVAAKNYPSILVLCDLLRLYLCKINRPLVMDINMFVTDSFLMSVIILKIVYM